MLNIQVAVLGHTPVKNMYMLISCIKGQDKNYGI